MKDLFDITPRPNGSAFDVKLNALHPVFAGHFPANPVLPGICSLMIVRECAERATGREMRYDVIQRSKFLAAITPDTQITVVVNMSEPNLLESVIVDAEGTAMVKLKATMMPR